MLHGKHIFAYGRKSLFSLFRTSRAPWPHNALKVHFNFCCKIAVKRCFPLVDWSLVFCVSSLGLFFYQRLFSSFIFCIFQVLLYVPSETHSFQYAVWCSLGSSLQMCVSLQTYSKKMKHWNCQFSPQDFGITISLTWIAKNQHAVNSFDDFSSFSEAILMLPMQHGKQNHDKTSVKTLEVSLCGFRWRPL